MSAFYMNEAMFELPEGGFVDRSLTYLEGAAPSGGIVVLLVERHPMPEGKSLRQAMEAHVADAKTRLRGYSVLSERDVEVTDIPAVDVAVRWRDDGGAPVYTRQVHFALGTTWMIVAGEAPFGDRVFCDASVDSLLSTLRLRE